MSEKRPYGLTEDDHIKLYRVRNVLRLFQYMNEDKHLCSPEPELVGDFHCLIADLLDQVLASAEAGDRSASGRARA
ncbi:hypothetical protein [Metapseudomonas otitidis]|uniref:hypothetical protein n=1 Tax=Metapseudomonas otitidis TaxID=319939 RepID=UPI0013F5CFE3|nr:hypothetical protein [Pseudomonas otitidis]